MTARSFRAFNSGQGLRFALYKSTGCAPLCPELFYPNGRNGPFERRRNLEIAGAAPERIVASII
jgi:hypothetical protein